MILDSAEAIDDALKRHYNFRECIIEDLRWKHQGTIMDLVLNYVWDDSNSLLDERGLGGRIRDDLSLSRLRILRFHMVQELHLRNDLNEFMLHDPNRIDWGLSEVAAIVVEPDSEVLTRFAGSAPPFHHVACLWEGNRRIDIVFALLEVLRDPSDRPDSDSFDRR